MIIDLVAAHDAIMAELGMPTTVKMGTKCAVHEHDEWVPLNDHHIHPLGMGGPDTPENLVTVCMNGHGAIHAYFDLLIKMAGVVPWDTRSRFGQRVRGLATMGWTLAGQPTRGRS